MNAERLSAYLLSLETDSPPLLAEMEEFAVRHHVPIVRRETAALLRTLAAMKRPRRILEIGTAIGYSALVLSEFLAEGGRIDTIEQSEERIARAREYISRAGKSGCVTLYPGDAADVLATLAGPYDFIFMDAAKGQYPHFLPEAVRLLEAGGVLVTDNVLQDGTVLESRYAVKRRDRTIHSRMRAYLYELKHRPDLVTAVTPVGDGVAVSVKKSNEK